jgi:stage II sporulation protein M
MKPLKFIFPKIRIRLSENGNLENVTGNITAHGLFVHNFQSTLVIAFMGLFSFSVLGIVLYVINIGLIGVIVALFQLAGYSAGPLLLAGVAPHGIFEIPALIISCAAVLHIGLTLVTPQAHRTLGEVMLEALADWFKVSAAIVAPLLMIAAIIETYVTPQLLCNALEIVCK